MKTNVAVYSNDFIELEEISNLALFRGVNLAPIEGMVHSLPLLELEEGKTLISPADPNHTLYLVLSGRLKLLREPGDSESIGAIVTGECVGELAVMSRKPGNIYVVAEKTSRLLVVDEDKFMELINASHGVARNYILILMQHLREKDAGDPEYIRLHDKYKRFSSVDDLTGLHNRRWLDDILTRQIMRSSTNKKPLSVIIASVDGFRQFNDEYGKNSGDQALYTVAQVMMKNARPTDLLARYEGEKFAIILPDTDMHGAEVLAARLRKAINETRIVVPNECILPPVTLSQGIAQLKAFVSAEKLIADCMAAVELASVKGGNQIAG